MTFQSNIYHETVYKWYQGMRTFYFSPVLRDAEVSCDPSDGSTLLFQGVQFILCLNLNIIHSHHFFHSSLCACLAFLVLVCCLVCRSCPLARSSIYHHDYQASTRHHLQQCSIYILIARWCRGSRTKSAVHATPVPHPFLVRTWLSSWWFWW